MSDFSLFMLNNGNRLSAQSTMATAVFRIKDGHQPIDREPPEIRIADAGEVRRRDSRAVVRRAHGQVLPVERLNNFGGQDGLELFGIGVFMPEVAEHISAPPHHFQLFSFHRNISFSLFKRSGLGLRLARHQNNLE